MTEDVVIMKVSKLSNSQLVRLLAMDGLSKILLEEASLRLGVEGTAEASRDESLPAAARRRRRYAALWAGQPETDTVRTAAEHPEVRRVQPG